MTQFLGGRALTDSGQLLTLARPGVLLNAAVLGGWAMDPLSGYSYIEAIGTVAVPSSAQLIGGAAYTTDGARYVTDEANAASDVWIGGRRHRQDGALRISLSAPAANDPAIGGWVTKQTGESYTSGVTFSLPFLDAGAGAVSTVAGLSGVAATFVRATAATTVGPTGLVVRVGTGVPRSYYDATSLAYLGYLAEGSRTNLCLQSEDLSTTWTVSAAVVVPDSAVAPDGATTADKLRQNNTAAQHLIATPSVVYSAAAYTLSFFAKAAELSIIRAFLPVAIFGGGGGNVDYTLTGSGTISNVTAGITNTSIKVFPNGWYRCALTFTSLAAASVIQFYLNQGGAPLGNNIDGLFIWGCQIEQATFASTYIPTVAVAVTRDGDVLTYPATAIQLTQGTFLWRGMHFAQSTANQARIAASDGSLNNRVGEFNAGNQLITAYRVVSGGVAGVLATGTAAFTPNAAMKSAMAWAVNDFSAYMDGVSDLTDLSLATPVALTTIYVGVQEDGTGTQQTFGTHSGISYVPSRLSDAMIRSITGT